jgi:phage terminase large subunit-like protein
LGQWVTPQLRKAYGVLVSGGGARSAPQVFSITTPGDASERDSELLGQLLNRMLADGVVEKPSAELSIMRDERSRTLVYEWAAQTRDLDDVEAVKRANPASWVTLEYLESQRHNPELSEAQYWQLHAGVWADAAGVWLTRDVWDACREPGVVIPAGSRVYVGVDVGLVHDSTAVVCAWLRPSDGRVVLHPRVWGVEAGAHVPVAESVDLAMIEEYIRGLTARYDIGLVVYDPRFFDYAAKRLGDEGVRIAPLYQSSALMADAYQAFYSGVLEGRVAHDDRVLDEHVAATAAEMTDRGWRVRKMRQTRRIDATVASAMAFAQAEADPGSVYSQRGVLVIDLDAGAA